MAKFIFFIALLISANLFAVDAYYLKNTTLYKISQVEKGGNQSQKIATSVHEFFADNGAIAYKKGGGLYIIPDSMNPTFVNKINTNVGNFKLRDGVLTYEKGSYLYVMRVNTMSDIRVSGSHGLVEFETIAGEVLYTKSQTTLYRVTSLETGSSELVEHFVGGFKLSN